MLNLILEKYAETHHRQNIRPGMLVEIVEKHNQKNGNLTKGYVKDILTSKGLHTRGIKVRLISGQVGRVQRIIKR
jgi:uncharacterized repeat protein (TIGR03833 family)